MIENKEYNVYIDESGDEGIRRGSKYFILTAILVEKDKDLGVAKVVDKIKENLEINIKTQLHWNTIKGYPNKLMIMQNIKDTDITIINIVIDTNKINFILKKNNEKFKIDYNKIKSIKIYPNSQKKLLQLADCCCSALGQALKYNDEKHHNYISYLKDKFYMYRKKYLGYGLKYVPGNIEYSKEFNDLIIYLDK